MVDVCGRKQNAFLAFAFLEGRVKTIVGFCSVRRMTDKLQIPMERHFVLTVNSSRRELVMLTQPMTAGGAQSDDDDHDEIQRIIQISIESISAP